MPLHSTVDYKNFFELILMENEIERDKQLIELIDSHLNKHYLDDDRTWFNRLCNNGLLNVILHCKNTIPGCSLYDHRYDANHFSNVSFFWSIQSGNVELIKYFINDKDFHLFMEREKFDHSVATMLKYYKERKPYFNNKDYEELMFFLAEQLPSSIEEIFDKASRENKNDESTEVLKKFLVKYKNELTNFLSKEGNDSLTIHCMLNMINESYDFAKFIRKEFQAYELEESRVRIQLYWIKRDVKHFNWMVDNPDFFKLEPKHFDGLFEQMFKAPFNSNTKKEDYEYFNTVIKKGLHKVTKEEFEYFIMNNFTPLVKKHYKNFNLNEFKELLDYGNTCTNFIQKKIVEKDYNELQKELKINNIKTNKMKI